MYNFGWRKQLIVQSIGGKANVHYMNMTDRKKNSKKKKSIQPTIIKYSFKSNHEHLYTRE